MKLTSDFGQGTRFLLNKMVQIDRLLIKADRRTTFSHALQIAYPIYNGVRVE